MKRTTFLALLATVSGCASNAIVGHGRSQSGRYFHPVGITGHGINLTIGSGSKVPKLSVIGDDCTVTIEDGADVAKIEFWGNGSTVSVPGNLVVYTTQVGNNRIIHRTDEVSTEPAVESEASTEAAP